MAETAPAPAAADKPSEAAWSAQTVKTLDEDADVRAQYEAGSLTVKILTAAVAVALGSASRGLRSATQEALAVLRRRHEALVEVSERLAAQFLTRVLIRS